MCFSAEADIVAGLVVTGMGIDALRHTRSARDIPLAALPVVFGIHQAIEAVTWWGLDGRAPEAATSFSMWAYLIIAFGILPVLVPAAIYLMEDDPDIRRRIIPFGIIGVIVASTLVWEMATGPVGAEIAGRYICYEVDLEYGGQITALYVVATCGPIIVSGSRRIVIYGLLNLVAVATLGMLMSTGVISLWCAWAAVTSVAISIHMRAKERVPDPVHEVRQSSDAM
ncbi:hypothetical protein HQ535_01115 [bacterium]|nr:hypothetical protein [bacterium]